MMIHVPTDLEESVRAAVLAGSYASEEAFVAEAIRAHLHQLRPQATELVEEKSAYQSIWDEIAELQKSVPDEEWDKLPVDGADQHDHYIYGSPKRPAR